MIGCLIKCISETPRRTNGARALICRLICALAIFTGGCDLFEYSPFCETDDDSGLDDFYENIRDVEAMIPASPDSFVFAFLTDTHSRYDDFEDAVASVNANPDVMFVIHGGDITDTGLQKEFSWAEEIMDEFRPPVFPVIGNHDCLSNGKKIYERMFGPAYYAFDFILRDGRVIRFLFLNDNTLEYNLDGEQVQTMKAWMDSMFAECGDAAGMVVTAHVPPSDSLYFTDAVEELYHSRLAASNVLLSIHGHVHEYYFGEYYGDGVPYLVGDDIRDRSYCLITVYTKQRLSVNVTRCYF